ncbi:hypothetical protein ACOBQX_21360 [Actinokineospora sp. G85]|uniref:hypothetical protein n=1 Tax=Actinokineospora sp. G85 TaxID=3406626 RepID=UPI003C7389CE
MRSLTRLALVAAVALTSAAAAGTAAADDWDTPASVPAPSLVTQVVSTCDGPQSGVEVIIEGGEHHMVTLDGSGLPATRTRTDREHNVETVTFKSVPIGSYTVLVEGADRLSDRVPVAVRPCAERDKALGELSVDVSCVGGWGQVGFEVANPATRGKRVFDLAVHGSPAYQAIEVGKGVFQRFDENYWDDGTYLAVLTGDGLTAPLVREFTISCSTGNRPGLGTYAQCDDKDDLNTDPLLWVEIDNVNRQEVVYTVTTGSTTRAVTVPGASHGTAAMGVVGGGDHDITVTGSDGSEWGTGVSVDFCADVVLDDDGLQVSTRCVDGVAAVTARFFAVGPYPSEREFSVDGTDAFTETVRFDGDGVYQWTRHAGTFANGTHTARLTGPGLDTVERFSVGC